MTGTAGTSRGRTGGGVVPGRVELPTSTLSVWRSNQLSYRTGTGSNSSWPLSFSLHRKPCCAGNYPTPTDMRTIIHKDRRRKQCDRTMRNATQKATLQKGGVPAAPSGTATLLRLSPNHRSYPRPTLAVTAFRHPRLSWLDGRCVQGPGTYSPRHG